MSVNHGSKSSLGMSGIVLLLLAAAACRVGGADAGCLKGPGLGEVPLTGSAMTPKTLALSFDGGPADATPILGELLAANGVQAVFFVAGGQIEGREGMLARLKASGHLVGNYGYSQKPLHATKDPVRDVQKTDELITPFVTGGMFLLRAPEGKLSGGVAQLLNEAGLERYVGPIGADVSAASGAAAASCHPSNFELDACVQAYGDAVEGLQKGILQLPAVGADAIELTRRLLMDWKDAGYTFVRLDQVPGIRNMLEASGGTPGMVGGPGGCEAYK